MRAQPGDLMPRPHPGSLPGCTLEDNDAYIDVLTTSITAGLDAVEADIEAAFVRVKASMERFFGYVPVWVNDLMDHGYWPWEIPSLTVDADGILVGWSTLPIDRREQ